MEEESLLLIGSQFFAMLEKIEDPLMRAFLPEAINAMHEGRVGQQFWAPLWNADHPLFNDDAFAETIERIIKEPILRQQIRAGLQAIQLLLK